ncbi:MAG: starch-binding protein, partial [Duncaniella sp.]|nr:starch-binding protein [Duncaniella sp.]
SNNKTPRSQSGRAYYGTYMEGNISASDFGEYTATGNAAKTLNGDLAQHIIRLNKIRAAVPALRKGQYTFDGCSASGGWAFKRAYKDSYALVAINGGATFTGVPSGNYVDLVTGKSYTPSNGSITVDAPRGQGQLRVLVKGWTGGKVGSDGKFIYSTSPVAHGGNPQFEDPGTTHYYTADDAVGKAAVTFSPDGGTFKTATLTVTATLNEVASSGWYQVGNGARGNLSKGTASTFTIGSDMAFGETVTVSWGADNMTGKVSYRKVDPNATITIYVTGPTAPNFYAWYADADGKNVEPNGSWPGRQLTSSMVANGRTFYHFTFDEGESVNFIFNNGSAKTADITGVTEDSYYEWDGGTGYRKLTGVNDDPVIPTGNEITVYFDDSRSNWGRVNVYVYGDTSDDQIAGGWPGKAMTKDAATGYYTYTFTTDRDHTRMNVIFNNGSGSQTGDNVKMRQGGIYNVNGDSGMSGIVSVGHSDDMPAEYYNLQGIRVDNPSGGIYIMRRGTHVKKVFVR